jgi:ABC-type bacteriocin/lantibiotic exporter with double-glycine peptidase domain
MRKIIKAIGNHKLFCLGVMLWSLALNGVFTVLDPLINKYLIDLGLVEHRVRLFAWLAAAVVLVGVIFRIGMWLNALLIRRLQNAVTSSLTMRMLKAYFETACPEVTGSSPGYFIARIYDEPAQVAANVVTVGIGLCVYAASLVGALAVSAYLAWRLTMALLVAVPILFWLARKFQPQISEASARENEEEARTRGTVGQVIEAYKTVKLFSLEGPIVTQVYRQLTKRLGLGYETVRTSASYETLSGVLLSFAEALVLIGAGYEVVNGRLSIGGLFGFMSAFWKIINAGTSLVSQFSALAKVTGQVDRLLEFEHLPKDAAEEEKCHHAAVELATVAVTYGAKTVLDNIDLAIEPSERLLIVGPNGSGKSTLANVIAGFVRPSGGTLKRPRRDRITALLTPFHFIPGTLKDNVNFDRLDLTKQELFLKLAGSFDLADKCDLEIAAAFSEGEKKKAQIIMTLLKDADLCLFDEPFAHLDVPSKHKAMDIIRHHTRGKALAVIMHGDDQFYEYFDRVISLKNGVQTEILATEPA